ncbi:MAG: hypothetical protein KAI47_26760, partial [Deltaproteobacteria bacterium]|nr:hypothetical protein [Deltaproteobacteria bacterium]
MKSLRLLSQRIALLLFGGIVFLGNPTPKVWGQGVNSDATSRPHAKTTHHQGSQTTATEPWRVLEATRVWIDGKHEPLVSGTHVATGTTLRLGTKSRMHLLLGKDLLLSAAGQGRIILGSAHSPQEIRVLKADMVQISGQEGALELNGWKIVLSPQGATALVKANYLYVRRGSVHVQQGTVHVQQGSVHVRQGTVHLTPSLDKANVAMPAPVPATSAPATATTVPATVPATRPRQQMLTLRRGNSMLLSNVGDPPIKAFQAIPRAALRKISRYRAPAPWKPKHTRSLQMVLKRVRRQAKRQGIADNGNVSRSLKGPAARNGLHLCDGFNATPTLEGRNATLGVRVRG